MGLKCQKHWDESVCSIVFDDSSVLLIIKEEEIEFDSVTLAESWYLTTYGVDLCLSERYT